METTTNFDSGEPEYSYDENIEDNSADFYSIQEDMPYFDVKEIMYKLNSFIGDDFTKLMKEQNFSAARGFLRKIQKRPDIRSNFVSEEWSALEEYINNEELKNAYS